MTPAEKRVIEDRPDPDVCEELLAQAKVMLASHPNVFLSRGRLVELVQDRGRTRLIELTRTRIRSLLWLCGPWHAWLEEGGLQAPSWLPAQLLLEQAWPEVRQLIGLTDIPVLRPDGSVLTTAGYDEATGLVYTPSLKIEEIPASPSEAEARVAAEELNRILDTFPLVSRAHRSSMLAAMLTPLARSAFDGTAPLFLLDAPCDGGGATAASEILGRLLCGQELMRVEKPLSDSQFRRKISRLTPPDDGMVLIEGVRSFAAADTISSALLDWRWADGGSHAGRERVTWFARGTNVELTRAAAEGILPIRFFDTGDQVRTASFEWPHPLENWVAENRPRFVRAALTLLRGYICAGKPNQPIAPWAGFAGWTGLISSALVWGGFEDPLLARRSLAAAMEDDDGDLRTLIVALAQVCPPRTGFTTREIVKRSVEPQEGHWRLVIALLRERLGGSPFDARHVGNLFRTLRGVSIEGVFLHRIGGDMLGYARWTIEKSPLVAKPLPSLHKRAEAPAPDSTFVRAGDEKRLRADDPDAPVDRIADYPVVVSRSPAIETSLLKAPPVAASAPMARLESAESAEAQAAPLDRQPALPAAPEAGPRVRGSAPPLPKEVGLPGVDLGAELDKVAAALRTNGGLNVLMERSGRPGNGEGLARTPAASLMGRKSPVMPRASP
jgi:hypothetical protein